MLSDAEISRRTTETSGIVSRSETLSKMQSTTIRDTARFGKETREKSERSSATLSFLSLPSWNREIFDGKNKVTLLRLIIIIIFNYFFLNIRISFFSLSIFFLFFYQLFQKYGRRFERVREFVDESNESNVQEVAEQHFIAEAVRGVGLQRISVRSLSLAEKAAEQSSTPILQDRAGSSALDHEEYIALGWERQYMLRIS